LRGRKGRLFPTRAVPDGRFGHSREAANFIQTIQRVRDLASENADYKDELQQLHSDLVACVSWKSKPRSANLLSMKERTGPGALIPVIGHWRPTIRRMLQAITIDHGANEGVKQDAV